MGVSDDRVEFGVTKVVTKGVDGLVRGIKDEDAEVCIIGSGVVQSLEVSKGGDKVDGIKIVEIPKEGDMEDGRMEGN